MKIAEVATRLSVSINTITRWYKFKRLNPDNEFAQKLPEYTLQVTPYGKVRDWTEEDVWKLVEFKQQIKAGRTGKMGKYGGAGTHGKKED